MKKLLIVLPILFLLACGGKKVTKPGSNPAPANLLFGTWNGTLNMTFPNSITQDPMVLTVANGSVSLKLSNALYSATLQSAVDPNIVFTADLLGFVGNFSGQRANNIINGTATIPALSANGTWSVIKQ